MTTSSPGFQRVTPGPTFQTTPEASEPPMWWSSSGCERKTDTGLPRAAQTLLKLTPAAMTRTTTSKAAGSGTSISSTWKASLGSPSRSWRMTQAAMVGGSSPGSVSMVEICVRSTAMRREPSPWWLAATRPQHPQDGGQHQDGQRRRDGPDEEGVARGDVAHEPAEVLAEEAGDEGQRQEDRAQQRKPGRARVEPVGVAREVDPDGLAEQLAQVVHAAHRRDEDVVDLAEGVARGLALEAGERLEQLPARREQVALGAQQLLEAEELPAQPGDVAADHVAGVLEGLFLEVVDALGL